ncbi:MAG: permease-like cell division protein FtsX [Clostridiales Family XIII bacterium]|jgi:cell division transport system permease protein|nr:permease-like cell division protein FtsX [Clostridiales Family XIII bacterium]
MILNPLITIKQALSQIGRNIAMTFASLFSITAILLILGLFFIIVVNINNVSQSIKENFDTVQVNLLDATDEVQTQSLMNQFKPLPGVESVEFQTREQALDHLKEKWGDSGVALEGLPVNPLPNAIVVKVAKLEDAGAVVELAKKSEGVEKINYAQDTANKLIKVTGAIQSGALILIACLLFISIVVVSNTIKLTVIAREREITIMKYIGATNWYIRGPFLLEGMFIGLISAVISSGVVAIIYHNIIGKFGIDFAVMLSTGFVAEGFMIKNLIIIFIAIGISIGTCGSIISMRRFLDR